MDSIYVFRYIPSSIKKQILYFTGQGTRTSGLIKEAYNELYQPNEDIIIDRSMGFMGCKCMIQKYLIRKIYRELCSRYIIDMHEYWLMPQHMYEIDGAKIHYYYNYSNEYLNKNPRYKYSLDISLLSDEITFQRLFRCKINQLISEEL